jgi:lysophospholipase L1-like esterase
MLSRLLVLLMLPLTAAQGLWLKYRARRLPGAPGERRGMTGPGEPLHLLAIGDSIIDGVGVDHMDRALPALFAHALSQELGRAVRWQICGQSGIDIDGLLQRIDALNAGPVDVILISIGVNDVTGLSSARHWRNSVGRLIDRLRTAWPSARILFAGLPPMARFPLLPQPLRFTLGWRADTLDSIAAGICRDRPDVWHVPTVIDPRLHTFSDDGYHPSGESCAAWARVLARHVAAESSRPDEQRVKSHHRKEDRMHGN